MKINVTKELKSRLQNAALNGSIIAKDILVQINSNADVKDIVRGTSNYFATKRKKQVTNSEYTKIKVLFTACTKDVTNDHFPDKNNPEAPWFDENRTDIEPSTFVGCFKHLPEYTSEDQEYFANAICVDSRVTVKLYDKMKDFIEAYRGDNYAPIAQMGDSTLHNSCMRHENTTRNAADFYYNFAGAKIIMATDAANNVLGRAVVWENAVVSENSQEITVSVLDRVYYTHSFVMKMIYQYSEKIGINLRKKVNDYYHPTNFIIINPVETLPGEKGTNIDLYLKIKVPASKWHKTGAPYMDTFQYLIVSPNGTLELINHENDNAIAHCQSTSGQAERLKYICPKCGTLHSDEEQIFCDQCYEKLTEFTLMGRMLKGKTIKYENKPYPAVLFHKGHPIPELSLYLQINKLF